MFLFRLVKIKKFSEKSRNCFHLMQWSYPTKILSKCSHNATSPKQPIHPTFIFFFIFLCHPIIHATRKMVMLFMLRRKRVYYYSCYGGNGYIIIHATGKAVILFMLRGKWVYYYSWYGENGYIIIHATGKMGILLFMLRGKLVHLKFPSK